MRLSLRLGLGLVPQLYASVSALSLSFSTASVLDSRITFTRASLAMRYDSTGKLTYAPNNLLVHSNDPTSALWTKSALSVVGGVSDPDGGNNAFTLTATAASAYILRGSTAPDVNAIVSVWLRRRTGVGVVYLNTPQNSLNVTQAITGTWARYSVAGFTAAGAIAFVLGVNVSGDAVDFYCGQSEVVTYETTPRTYNATTGSAFHGARLDHNPATLAPLGLLIEETRTNLVLRSQEFDNAAWFSTGTPTVTANATTAPDGTTTAEKFINTGAAEYRSQNYTAAAASYTASVYAKQAEASQVHIERAGGINGSFNLATGAVISTAGGATATITSVGDGWYRCSITWTDAGGATTLYIGRTSGTANSVNGIFLWGAQLEAGAFATSYIPTVAATVTRAADSASMTGANFSSWFTAAQGTFVFEGDSPGSGTRTAIAADDNTANEAIRLYTSALDPKLIVVDGAITQADIDAGAITANTAFKLAASYTANSFAASVGGAVAVTDLVGTLPTVDRLRIGVDQAGNYLNGHAKSVTFHNTVKSVAELSA